MEKKKDRQSEWVDNSMSLMHIEMLLVGNAQGLGLLDVELIKEFPKLKINSKLEKDRLKKLRHITLSELWVMGAYELVRFINNVAHKHTDIFEEETMKKIKENITLFTEIRIPLTRFQKMGQNQQYSGVSQPIWDSIKSEGWKVHFSGKSGIETKKFYRKDLSDSLLALLKKLKEDITNH